MLKVNGSIIEFENYANGEYCLKEKFIDSVLKNLDLEECIANVEWYYRGNEDFSQLLFLKGYLDDLNVESFLEIKYLPYSRMDRSGDKGYPFTLKYVSEYIKFLGFSEISINECHSDIGLELLEARQILTNEKLLVDVKKEISFDNEKDVIVFPDNGAAIRYETLGKGLVCDKVRNFTSGRIESLKLKEENIDLTGSKAIIIDDLSSFGGTHVLAAEELKRKGAKEIYLLITHAENNIFNGSIFEKSVIDKVFTTDSILTEQNYWNHLKYKDKLKVYEI